VSGAFIKRTTQAELRRFFRNPSLARSIFEEAVRGLRHQAISTA
jgi:hypothetical protein